MSEVKFMNVWRSTETGHQWGSELDNNRAFSDIVAASVHEKFPYIRRVGVLRVRMKPGFERGAAA